MSMILIAAVALAESVPSLAAPAAFPPDLPVARVADDAWRRSRTPASVQAEPIARGRWRCTFRFRPNGPVERVHLAGDFNGWQPNATSMTPDPDGSWSVTIEVESGVRLYKFVVDGDQWIADPRNDMRGDDGHGGANTVLLLGAESLLDPALARRGDGRIEAAGLEHDPALARYLQSMPDGSFSLRFRSLRGDVERVDVVLDPDGERALDKDGGDDRFDYWSVRVPAERAGDRYTFVITDGARRLRHDAINELNAPENAFRTPDWAKHAIWYQIMVDRFRNGGTANDPDPVRPWRSKWYEASPWEGRDGQSFYEYFVFSRLYGGDIDGLVEKLDYLRDLGVNALYLNPVFESESHHKYNATNFVHIDRHYGKPDDDDAIVAREDLLDPSTWEWTTSDRIFLDFLREAKSRGFHVVIDGVFNHVGTRHPAFQDVLKNGRASRFADWFEVTSWDPFEYAGWAGFGELPVFAKTPDGFVSDAVRQHVFDVTRRWMDPDGDGDPSDGIDGWRLDVPNEVPLPFWAEWREHVKSINPDAYIVGEIWDRAEQWLDGRTFDAVMNYQFARPAVAWVGNVREKLAPSELDRRLADLRAAYPAEATYVLQNLVDSHDTDRIASKMKNPDRGFDEGNREQQDASYDGSKPGEREYRRVRLLALLQMTYVGAPMIYYGDEVGMWGSDDPNNRKPMLWKDLEPYEDADENFVMESHLAAMREMIDLRNAHEALRVGDFETVLVDDARDLWGFRRATDGEEIVVVLNASDRDARVSPSELDALDPSERDGWRTIHVTDDRDEGDLVPAIGGRVWIRDR